MERQEKVAGGGDEESERLIDGGMTVVDFDVLCSTVALQTQGKWSKLQNDDVEFGLDGGELGGVLRLWEGQVLDCFDDRRIALQSACCPCYRFGKNMKRAGFGSPYIQGTLYFILAISALLNFGAFVVTKRRCYLYLAVVFTLSLGAYLGFYRTQIKRKFNIMGTDSFADDCISHLVCPCCTLSQESRTLEMNNVQDGTWHGRGDTICIGSFSEGSKALFELTPPLPVSIKPPNPSAPQKNLDTSDVC